MKRKIAMVLTSVLTATMLLTGCNEQTGEATVETVVVAEEAEAETPTTEEVKTVVEEEPTEEVAEPYTPSVCALKNPITLVATTAVDILSSDKDGEVVGTLAEGEEFTAVGTTGKGYYVTEEETYICATGLEVKAEEVTEEEEKVADTTTTTQNNNTTPTTQESQPEQRESQPTQQTEQPTQQESQPVQEQTPVAEQTPTPAPEPTPAPTPEPQPTQEVPVINTIRCDMCGATFATEEECIAHLYAAHVEDPTPSPIGCAHPNAWEDENGMLYCPDCGGYVSHNG